MATSTRFSSSLAKRSIVARIAALMALALAGVAIYLVVMNFAGSSESTEEPKNDKKGRSAQAA